MADNVTDNAIAVRDVVKLRCPADSNEALARYDVVELRGPRVLVRLQCHLPIPPIEAVAMTDVMLCHREA